MATKRLLVSEVLWYFLENSENFDKVNFQNLVSDFFSHEELSAAKKILINEIENLKKEKKEKLFNKSRGNTKIDKTLDVIDLLKFILENEMAQLLPTFVILNIKRIPNNPLTNLTDLFIKNEKIENKINQLLDTNKNVLNKLTAALTCTNNISTSSDKTYNNNNIHLNDSKEITNTPIINPKISWVNKMKNETQSDDSQIVGSQADDSFFTASKQIIKKKIFYVGNVDLPNSTMIVKHCESKGIKVITCLPVSKKNDTDDPPSFTSFRLCVPAAEFNKVMSPSNWPSSVLIRE
ncbi:hypothetical protein HELRODRAFT_176713 [Helobdella robusta]|uniref:Uncharacterized protein n=1 Tax=Helobdella robusta TaxID=6412 RepID=T1FAT4_HELRO|nr:hypothetical protein HELRODRAFT_176713 [Helobdella robusta]ESN99546.1 hypothetical protein HELRODRAFT_176713 [Helobdella robusta]